MRTIATRTLGAVVALAAGLVAGAAQAADTTYNIDPLHTLTTFGVPHYATSTNTAKFPTKAGSIVIDKAAKKGAVDITIDVAGVVSGVPLFDEHLRSEKWLNTGKFPTATFKSKQLTFNGDKVTAAHGDLTFLGKTAPVHLTAKNFNCYENPMLKREVCGGDFETTIQRSDWGLTMGIANGMPDDVKLTLQVEAVKQ